MQRLDVGQGKREERRLRRVAVSEGDDLRGLDLAVAEPLDDSRSDGDGGRDLLGVPAAHLQALQPAVDLVGRQLARERDQPEPPGRHIQLVLLRQCAQARQERHGLLVGR